MANSPRVILWACWLALASASLAAAAMPEPRVEWLHGKALEAALAEEVTISWSNTPLRRALQSLGSARQVCIVLDRRLDPGQPLELALDHESLRQGLRRIAEKIGAGYCQFGAVAYLGPATNANRLRTLAAARTAEARALSPVVARRLTQERAWQWDELAEPKVLAQQLASQAEVQLDGLDQMPHDLWPRTELPPLTWIERLTLLASEFDLTFRIDDQGAKVCLIPIPSEVSLARSYRVHRDTSAVAKRWAKELPTARVTSDRDQIRVDGRLEDHEAVARLAGGKISPRPSTAGKAAPGKSQEVYQLSVENAELDKVVSQLAGRLNLSVRWDQRAIAARGLAVDQLITVKVAQASLDELLAAVFRDTGLAAAREGRVITIAPSGAASATRTP